MDRMTRAELEAEEISDEELEAAGDMYDRLKASTFYKDHEDAVAWLKSDRKAV